MNGAAAAYHPVAVLRRHLGAARARVLVYHRVCNAPRERAVQYWNVAPAGFEMQLDFLLNRGYTVVTAGQIVRALTLGRRLPNKAVAITFDDGFANNYAIAYRALKSRGLSATFYVTTRFIGSDMPFPFTRVDPAISEAGASDDLIWRPLRWNELAEMRDGGMEIESHSHTHPFFSTLTPQEIDMEIEDSMRTLKGNGFHPFTFAASYSLQGDRLADLVRALKAHGIQGAFMGGVGSVRSGLDLFDLPRIPIYEADDLSAFARKIDGAYDWISPLHPLWRRLFHRPVSVEARADHGTT